MSYNMDAQFQCMIPTIPKDYLGIRRNIYQLLDKLPIREMVFVGPESLRAIIEEDAVNFGHHAQVRFVDENDLLPFPAVREAYDKRAKILDSKHTISNPGWYYQQFLKMIFSEKCTDEYYLCWDADTIPLRRIPLFAPDGKPYLDIKPEYQQNYFVTMNNLLGLGKVIEKSFVSEHMLFRKEYMQELIAEITATSLPGETFYEKIFSAIEDMKLGFAEFETYGTWVATHYPDAYKLRNWRSLRNTNFLVAREDLTEDDIRYLATGFDAATFEKYQETEPELTELFRNPRYREKLTADIFYLELLKMGVFGEYSDGKLHYGDGYYAT